MVYFFGFLINDICKLIYFIINSFCFKKLPRSRHEVQRVNHRRLCIHRTNRQRRLYIQVSAKTAKAGVLNAKRFLIKSKCVLLFVMLFANIIHKLLCRWKYLQRRKQTVGPDDKYDFPLLSSWQIGWGLQKSIKPQDISKPEFGRTHMVQVGVLILY